MKNKTKIIITGCFLVIICTPIFFFINAINKDFLLKNYLKTTTLYTAKNDFLRFINHKSVEDINAQLPDSLKLESINLLISDSVLKNLDEARQKKLEVDVRINRNVTESYPVKLVFKGDTLNGSIRIRGDTKENFNRGLYNVSLRVDIKEKKGLLGLKKISFIRPFQDNSFFGFFYYNYFQSQNLLANRFQFVHLNINNKNQDIWILQEGFSNKLIKYNNLPEGLILRFDDDCMELNKQANPSGFPKLIPYEYKKVKKDTALNNSYNYLLNKIEQVKKDRSLVQTLFDLPKWAKYVALSDIFLSHHSQRCHNVKLYFNTQTKLLEPIAWDPNSFKDWPLEQAKNIYTQDASNPVIYQFFEQDTLFTKLYLNEVKANFTNNSIIQFITKYDNYVSILEPELNQHQASLKFEKYYIEENIQRYKRHYDTKQKLIISAYKKDKIVEIKNNCLLPVYCSYIELDNVVIPINRIIHNEMAYSFFVKNTPQKKIKAYYKLCNQTKLSIEKGNVFEYKIWN